MKRARTALFNLCLAAAGVGEAHVALAQSSGLPLDTLALATLGAFRPTGPNWRVVGEVTVDRHRESSMGSTPGSGVLLKLAAEQGSSVSTSWEHGDLELELEFMVPRGSKPGVYLQGRYEVQLADSWGVRSPTFADAGGIAPRWDAERGPGREGYEGHAPRVNAARAPGLWQSLSIRFQAPRFDAGGRKISDARFVRVEHNGVVIHENVTVTGPTRGAAFQDERSAGPLVFQGDQGPVAFRNVRFKRYTGGQLRVSGLRYRVYEGDSAALANATVGTPVRAGVADGISTSLAGVSDKFAMTFDGTISVPTAGTYLFELGFDWVDDDPQFKGTVVGGGRVAIDGRELLRHEGRLSTTAAKVELTAGAHPFSMTFYKNRSWTSRMGVELFAEGPGIERHALHAVRAPDLPGAITVEPNGAAVVLRSFVYHGQRKLTHAVSVGDPVGVHFSVDLAAGALLAAWRGPFAETTDMWHDRGNEQVMRPLGSVLTLPATPSLAFLPSEGAPWPDSLAADAGFAFTGYALDQTGRPTFLYRLGDVEVEDRIRPAEDGASLQRAFHLRAPDATERLFVRLASGTSIRRLADGSYLVDDASYYVAPDRGGPEPRVRQVAGGQELLAPVRFRRGEASLSYTLTW